MRGERRLERVLWEGEGQRRSVQGSRARDQGPRSAACRITERPQEGCSGRESKGSWRSHETVSEDGRQVRRRRHSELSLYLTGRPGENGRHSLQDGTNEERIRPAGEVDAVFS